MSVILGFDVVVVGFWFLLLNLMDLSGVVDIPLSCVVDFDTFCSSQLSEFCCSFLLHTWSRLSTRST